jgi:hypothetical protein
MARQNGPLQLTGSLGNLSFYHDKQHGYLVREKGGSNKLSARTRENAHELGEASRTGKLIRRAVRFGLGYTGDSTANQRLNSVLAKILRLDTVHPRGERTAATGVQTPEGRELLRAFVFDTERPASRMLHFPVEPADDAGNFALRHFVPVLHLSYPQAATHVQLRGATLFIDTAGDAFLAFGTAPVVAALTAQEQDLFLSPQQALPPEDARRGFRMEVISVVFLQESGGEWLPLEEGRCVRVV